MTMRDLPPSVRFARFQLAQSLVAAGQREPALEQLQLVLRDPGTDPNDASVFALLSELHESREDWFSALDALLRAIASDYRDVGRVARAHTLIARHAEAGVALPDSVIEKLEKSLASADDQSAWLLAGELWLQRGEYRKASTAFSRAPRDGARSTILKVAEVDLALGRAEEARQSLREASKSTARDGLDETRLRLLLARAEAETGHYPQALAALEDGHTAEHCFVRALVAVGQGHAEEALLDCQATPSIDVALLRALINLHAHHVDDARDDALAAAAQNPTSPDVLLVRAQVELESAENLEEGRGLLEQVFATMQQDLTKSRWAMLQRPFAKDRSTFQYFLAELADVSRTPDTLELAEAVNREPLSNSQEARLHYIRGKVLRARGQADPASDAFENAAANFDTAALIPAAVNSARQAFELGHRAWSAARLAKLLWDQSFSDLPDDERLRLVEQGSQIVRVQDLRDEDAGASDVLVYYAGFLDLRKTEFAARDRQVHGWAAVSSLMAAVLNSQRNPYRSRFLAEAFDVVGALGPATVVADRAFAWNGDDEMREAAIVARSNYYRGSASVEPLLGGFADTDRYGEWCQNVRFSLRIDSGEHAQLAAARPRKPFDAPWARFTEAKAVALIENVTTARPLFEKVAEELTDKTGNEFGAAEAWLHAGRPVAALEMLDKGSQLQNIAPRPAAWIRAMADIGSGATDYTPATRAIDGLAPILLSQALHVTLPILRQVYPTPAFTSAIGPLTEHIQRALARLEGEGISRTGLEDAPEAMRPLVLAMWNVIEKESGNDSGEDSTQEFARLKALNPGGRLGRVIDCAMTAPATSEGA